MGETALRDFTPADTGWLVGKHGRLYAASDGFDAGFPVLVAGILGDFIRNRDPAVERGFIAQDGARPLGSVFCMRGEAAGVARLRLFLVLPEARGQGLGTRLLRACIGFARDVGYSRLQLWTHESHKAACALYRAHGFACVSSRPVHSFGVDLVEQGFALDLGARNTAMDPG